MPKPRDEIPTTPAISSWMSGSLTLYPRYGAPRKLSFPCTLETQLLLQRLEQEQQGRENTNRRDTRREDHQKPNPAGTRNRAGRKS
jgi:hypothetical protein